MSSAKYKPPLPPKPKIFPLELTDVLRTTNVPPRPLSGWDVSCDSDTPRHDTNNVSGDNTDESPSKQGMASNDSTDKQQHESKSLENSTGERELGRGTRNVTLVEKGNTITEDWSLRESLESGDEACCTRFSNLIQRKAKEFSSHLTKPPKPPKPSGLTSSHSNITRSLPWQPASFGDEISANSICFADEDISEVSSDYQDLDLSRVANEATAASVHHVTRTKVTSNVSHESEYEVIEPPPGDLTMPTVPEHVLRDGVSGAATRATVLKNLKPPPHGPSTTNKSESHDPLMDGVSKDAQQSIPRNKTKPKRPPPPKTSKTEDEVLVGMPSKMVVRQDIHGQCPEEVSAGEALHTVPHMQDCHSSTCQVKAEYRNSETESVVNAKHLSSADPEPEKVVAKKKRTPPPRPPPPKLKPHVPHITTIDDCSQTDDLTDYRTKNVIEHLDQMLSTQHQVHEDVASIENSLNMLVKETAHKFLPPSEYVCTAVVTENYKMPPKPPPRLKRRTRSRTVESVRTRVDLPRRSHSLSEADILKKKAYRDTLEADNVAATLTETFVMVVESPLTPQEVRTLYMNEVSEDCKSKCKEPLCPNPNQMRFRPLPAPPPPPRGRTKASSESGSLERRSSKSEQPKSCKELTDPAFEDTTNPKPAINEYPSKKRITEQGTELQKTHENDGVEATQSADNVIHIESKSQKGVDKNSVPLQVAHEKRVSGSTFYDCLEIPPEEQRGVESPLEGNSEKSRSSWFDDSDASGDIADVDSPVHPSDSDRPLSSSPSSVQRSKTKGGKEKKRPSSKFYCSVEERESSTDREMCPPVHPSPRRRKDKGEEDKGDDTDELLEMAEGLQKEMHQVLVERQKKLLQTLDSELSCQQVADPESKEQTMPSTMAKEEEDPQHLSTAGVLRKDNLSTLSTASEVSWQGSSDEESDTEDTSHLTSEEACQHRNKRKLFYIAREMATSENIFVDALRLLNVDFRNAVRKASIRKGYPIIPEDLLEQILKHLPQLQALNERLLSDLCDRVEHWENKACIADILVKIGPFLKLYSSYIMDFEPMTVALEEARRKYPDFAFVVREFQQSPRCKQLTLEQYMLKPIQRIPQYRLLLRDYVDHLSVDAEDYQDACQALEIVSQVANHANESMKLGDNFSKLISLQNKIHGHYEVIKPGRIIIREGELMKASRKIMQPRWFVLFSDSLLYLTPMQQGYYKVNYELPLSGMKVMVPQQPDYQNEFSIITTKRSFILSASSSEVRQLWITALNKAIEDTVNRKCSFLLLQKDGGEDSSSSELGKEAPVWIPDRRVTMCQLCTREFTFTHRRHHCRACGKVICSACSSNRVALHYVGPKPVRVCDHCYYSLRQSISCGHTEVSFANGNQDSHQLQEHANTKKRNVKGILQEVAANDQGSLLSGYLHQWWKGAWKRRWFVVKDHVLYVYRASEDICALRTVPLLGYQVQPVHKGFEDIPREHLFELAHSGINSLVFYADSASLAEQWKKAMEQATTLT
ncbi:FYVE, RhoGEF and PH domain-containing protein 6-like isoform X2 [Ornithodoros turicata]|uniref:FYVE, RhoGEF and PH domain-containing protein 6-like isoform X2 n=1 Tax=Ornithodoros turicata TaxID=34597 RepID=UPI003139780E